MSSLLLRTSGSICRMGSRMLSTESADISTKINSMLAKDDVVLFMKGNPAQPMCGFSQLAIKVGAVSVWYMSVFANPIKIVSVVHKLGLSCHVLFIHSFDQHSFGPNRNRSHVHIFLPGPFLCAQYRCDDDEGTWNG